MPQCPYGSPPQELNFLGQVLEAHAREGGRAAIEQDEDLRTLLQETQVGTGRDHSRVTRTAGVTWMTRVTRMTLMTRMSRMTKMTRMTTRLS